MFIGNECRLPTTEVSERLLELRLLSAESRFLPIPIQLKRLSSNGEYPFRSSDDLWDCAGDSGAPERRLLGNPSEGSPSFNRGRWIGFDRTDDAAEELLSPLTCPDWRDEVREEMDDAGAEAFRGRGGSSLERDSSSITCPKRRV